MFLKYNHVKRAIDLLVGGAALVGASPLMGAIAFLVKVDSAGPVFYRGVRTGYRGKPFRIFKFRTMHPEAEATGSGTTALNDPRVTRVGTFLREWKLDEIPQLINVVLGEMSLVGPRPELPQYTDRYTGEEKGILDALPGITDLSSIKFISLDEVVGADDPDSAYERLVLKEKNRLRLLYVKHQSLGLDARIILATALSLLRGKRSPPPSRLLPD